MPEFASEEDFERHRQQHYPRGSGPPLRGEDDPHYLDPDGASLDDHDPDRFLPSPGFAEEEVDDHPDLDIGHAPGPHPFGTPTYDPGGHYDDYDPHSAENLPPDEEHRTGAIRRQSDQWPDRVAAIQGGDRPEPRFQVGDPVYGMDRKGRPSPRKVMEVHHADDMPDPERWKREGESGWLYKLNDGLLWRDHAVAAPIPGDDKYGAKDPYRDSHPYEEFGHSVVDNLDPQEYLHNKDPEMGSTVPDMVGGDSPRAVTDARLIRKEESGLEQDVLARPSPDGKGYDILQHLGFKE